MCAAAVAPGRAVTIIYAMFAPILLQKAGLLTVFPAAMVDVGVWVAVVFLTGVPINAISRSLPERFVMTPVAIVLVACALVIAFGFLGHFASGRARTPLPGRLLIC